MAGLIVVLGALYGWALEPSAEPEEALESHGEPGVLVESERPRRRVPWVRAEAGAPTGGRRVGGGRGAATGGPDAGGDGTR